MKTPITMYRDDGKEYQVWEEDIPKDKADRSLLTKKEHDVKKAERETMRIESEAKYKIELQNDATRKATVV